MTLTDLLAPRHRDPYQVMFHAGAVYTMQDLVHDKVVVTHFHNLRPFNYDAERTDPVAVAGIRDRASPGQSR